MNREQRKYLNEAEKVWKKEPDGVKTYREYGAKSKAIQGKKDKRPNYGMGSRCVQCNKKHGRSDSGNVCKNCSENLPL